MGRRCSHVQPCWFAMDGSRLSARTLQSRTAPVRISHVLAELILSGCILRIVEPSELGIAAAGGRLVFVIESEGVAKFMRDHGLHRFLHAMMLSADFADSRSFLGKCFELPAN